MTDRELLELAAKAVGVKRLVAGGSFMAMKDNLMAVWNPLTDDGDALRLAVKLELKIDPCGDDVYVADKIRLLTDESLLTDDPYAATRRAIVRAAAEIGKELK